MKTFEEKFTAWVDGVLTGGELAEFESELANVKDADLDKIAAHQIGDLFREHGRAPELQNADFFNHQLMQQIEAEIPKPAAAPESRKFAWSLPRFALAGAFTLAVAVGLFQWMIPKETHREAQEAQNTMQIIHAQGSNPDITATAFRSQQNNVTVLWIDGSGMKYVPKKPVQTETPAKNKTEY